MDTKFSEILQRFRDLFVTTGEFAKAENVNSILEAIDEEKKLFTLTKEEVMELVKFSYDVGYISREFHSKTHEIFTRMEEFLDEQNPKETALDSAPREQIESKRDEHQGSSNKGNAKRTLISDKKKIQEDSQV